MEVMGQPETKRSLPETRLSVLAVVTVAAMRRR
jgi:hypothetical protein